MRERLERQTKLSADHRKTTADVGDISPEDVLYGQGLSSRNGAVPRDRDDRVTLFLAPGQWPRVFPGL